MCTGCPKKKSVYKKVIKYINGHFSETLGIFGDSCVFIFNFLYLYAVWSKLFKYFSIVGGAVAGVFTNQARSYRCANVTMHCRCQCPQLLNVSVCIELKLSDFKWRTIWVIFSPVIGQLSPDRCFHWWNLTNGLCLIQIHVIHVNWMLCNFSPTD